MKLLYRIVNVVKFKLPFPPDSTEQKVNYNSKTVSPTPLKSEKTESFQKLPSPPPSPRIIITKIVDKHKRSADNENLKSVVIKKPRCEVTPVLRSPEPILKISPIVSKTKDEPFVKPEHHKRKKGHRKRLIGEITRTAQEDLLKLKVRLTPCPPKVTYNSGQKKDKKEKVRSLSPEVPRFPNNNKQNELSTKQSEIVLTNGNASLSERSEVRPSEVAVEKPAEIKRPDPPGKDEEVLRKLGLVGIDEATKAIEERNKLNNILEATKLLDKDRLEKCLRESKANRKRSLMAEKRMRDTLKSMSNAKEDITVSSTSLLNNNNNTITNDNNNQTKKKEPPPLTPLRNNKRPSVTFAPAPYGVKCDSSMEFNRPLKSNALDLTVCSRKLMKDNKLTGILRTHVPRFDEPKPSEEQPLQRKTPELNLKTLSDAAVSLIDECNAKKLNSSSFKVGNGNTNILRIPQPYPRITNLGIKIKPNQGVRHIPNPQAIVASNHFRNQRSGYYGLSGPQSP